MTHSLTGGLGPPRIDGFLLDKATVYEQDYNPKKIKATTDLATGGRRESALAPETGAALYTVKHEITLHYRHLGPHLDLVECIFATPGPHSVIVWKRAYPTFAGDGITAAFVLPWLVATDFYSPPPGLSSGSGPFNVEAQVGLGGGATVLTVLKKSRSAYDAGTPGSGEFWYVNEDLDCKLHAALGAGQFLYVFMVPVLEMFLADAASARKYTAGNMMEPRDLVLVEQ